MVIVSQGDVRRSNNVWWDPWYPADGDHFISDLAAGTDQPEERECEDDRRNHQDEVEKESSSFPRDSFDTPRGLLLHLVVDPDLRQTQLRDGQHEHDCEQHPRHR